MRSNIRQKDTHLHYFTLNQKEGLLWKFFQFDSMHCFLCGKQTSSAGQLLFHMYRKIAPKTVNTVMRGIVLFLIGGFLAMVLFALSILPEAQKRRLGSFPIEIIIRVYSTFWWIPPSCGTMAATIGLVCPGLDSWLGKPHNFQREWSSVARCVAMFVGISHGTAVSFNLAFVLHLHCISTLNLSILLKHLLVKQRHVSMKL